MMVGSLLLLQKTELLKKINKIVGVSIGAVVGLLYAMGCNATEILEQSLITNISDVITTFDASTVLNGIFPHQLFRTRLESKIKDKIGFVPTFHQFYMITGYDLVCVVTNLDDDRTEYLNYQTEPDLLVTEAVLMSMNIPFLFHMYKYKEKIYSDGGILNPLPIVKFDNGKTDVLAVYLGETKINPQISLINYILKVIKLCSSQNINIYLTKNLTVVGFLTFGAIYLNQSELNFPLRKKLGDRQRIHNSSSILAAIGG